MNKEEKQEFVIAKLNEIVSITEELMEVAVTGEDGNLYEMSYHIKCYVNKIVKHLQREWKNNIKFTIRKEEKKKLRAAEKAQEEKETQELMRQIFEKFKK